MIEIELAVLIVVLIVGIALMIITHRSLVGRLYDRQKAMDAHMKAFTREGLVAVREAEKATAAAHQIRDDARQALQQVQAHMSHPEIKRLLGEL